MGCLSLKVHSRNAKPFKIKFGLICRTHTGIEEVLYVEEGALMVEEGYLQVQK